MGCRHRGRSQTGKPKGVRPPAPEEARSASRRSSCPEAKDTTWRRVTTPAGGRKKLPAPRTGSPYDIRRTIPFRECNREAQGGWLRNLPPRGPTPPALRSLQWRYDFPSKRSRPRETLARWGHGNHPGNSKYLCLPTPDRHREFCRRPHVWRLHRHGPRRLSNVPVLGSFNGIRRRRQAHGMHRSFTYCRNSTLPQNHRGTFYGNTGLPPL
jgi:hypothetical protein